ncbi:hypothetical protein Fmac_027480 [Flemingia macrophylla]|uniref:Uncharacterized protein n=1 Tax=Flemingia macrophylla TaxID=520843 RepID=A0ABD1LI03_9FABA
MSFYSLGMALIKDIPDIEGDRAYGIESFAAVFGPKRIFWTSVSLFEMAFGAAFLAGATSPSLLIKFISGVGNVVLALVLWYHAKSTDFRSKKSISSFFKLIWKLLCVEYLLMPLVR